METQYFDRQIRIENWDQESYSSMKVVCFGVGGLGSVVAINLCRLGVGHIVLMDYDTVDAHNLNRQLLYCKEDVGCLKVDAAKKALEASHNLVSRIDAYNVDIVRDWAKVVTLVQGCAAVFNMIDYGDAFDLAAQALCLRLGVPLIQGGTFSQTVNVEFFPANSSSCLACGIDSNPSYLSQIRPSSILELDSLSFLPKNQNPVGLSNCYLCGICGMMMVSKFCEAKLKNEGVVIANRTIFYVNSMESVNFQVDGRPGCGLCRESGL